MSTDTLRAAVAAAHRDATHDSPAECAALGWHPEFSLAFLSNPAGRAIGDVVETARALVANALWVQANDASAPIPVGTRSHDIDDLRAALDRLEEVAR